MIKWLVLIDLENLKVSFGAPRLGDFSFQTKLKIALAELKKIGKISLGIVFTPKHLILSYEKFFLSEGFLIVQCPEKENKDDSVDEQLIFLGRKLIFLPEHTHLCLGSGDGHFKGLLGHAKERGLHISNIVGNSSSLSQDIADLIDTLPETKKKHILDLTTLEQK